AQCRVRGAKVLVLAHPARGVDLAAARAIYERVLAAAKDDGLAVLVVSADLAELRALAGRILVMARGKIAAEFPPDVDDRTIGRAMLEGGQESEPAHEATP